VPAGGGFLALRLPGIAGRGRGHAPLGVPLLGAPFRAPGRSDRRRSGHLGPGHLPASRQHRPAGARPGTEILARKRGADVKKVAVVGAGSWGTALALLLTRSREPHTVSLWVHDPELAEFLSRERVNATYLPGHPLPPAVEVTNDLARALDEA